MVSIVFLQLAYALRVERLTRNGSFIEAARAAAACRAHARAVLARRRRGFRDDRLHDDPYFLFAWTSGQYFGGVAGFFVPVWPVKAVTILGSSAIAVQFLLRAWRHVRLARGGDRT